MSYIRQTGGRSDTVLCTMQCFLKKPLLHHLFHCRTMAVSLQVFPGRCLYDEPLRLKACGLGPGQDVTLQTTMVDEGDETFTSTGRYRAGNNGELDFSQAPALEGGSFTGIEPEGPLWALEPQKRYRRYLRKDVLTPQPVNFTLYEGHQQPEKILARVTQERWLMGEGLRRIPVREGRVRGSLFLPPGPGPFPGVIEIQGTGGGLLEYKACLLANKGFAVLALAYYKFDDLPTDMKEFHLEYFEEAVNYMLQHPQIKGPGIGLLGHSKGGDLVLSMASFLKGISATVVVNSSISNIGAALRYKDIFIPATEYDARDGPFPGVIDMFGDDGGLVEYRSSLLASHGFASLALPYLAFEDLPPTMSEFQLEYFEQAAQFLARHPKVRGPGVGVLGTGKGADLALSMITFLPQVVAAVSISGCCANTAATLHFRDFTLPGLKYDMSRVKILDSAVFDVFESLNDPLDPSNSQCLIPVEQADGHFLFIVGEDDRNWKSSIYAKAAMDRLRRNGKGNFTLLSYPEAGHHIDPPCSPFCYAAIDRVLGVPIIGGGELQAHCQAQEDSWWKIQDFFNLHLKKQ
uniref:Acyl-coenzyme A thioesterase 1-like n=2 Tax=Leptobrachium leishanense TaxID=445787 RepID=A0A8C5QZY9_9ANUR